MANYFASSDPHHGIQFIPSDILSGMSIWHICLAFHLACLLTFYLAYLLTFYLAFYQEYLLTFYLAYLTFYLADLLTFYLTFYLAFYLADLLTFYLSYLLTFCLSYLLAFYLAYLSGRSSDILSGISSYILCGILFGRSSYILSGISFGILFVISSDILSGISSDSDILSDILSGISSDILSDISIWHSIWQIFLHSIWHIYLADLLTFYLANLLTFYLAYLLTFYLALSLAFYMALFLVVDVRLKSGEAHGAPNLASWSPARPTALRPSPVEVRQGPRRSDPAWPTALRPSPVEVRRGPLRSRAGRWDLARLTAIKSWQTSCHSSTTHGCTCPCSQCWSGHHQPGPCGIRFWRFHGSRGQSFTIGTCRSFSFSLGSIHHQRAPAPWSRPSDRELVQYKMDTKSRPSWKTIAKRMNRTVESCQARWAWLKNTHSELLHPGGATEAAGQQRDYIDQ